MPERNRTIGDSGIRLGGNLLEMPPIVGTGVSAPNAIAVAAPLVAFIASLPYYLDTEGQLAYKSNTTTLTHLPILRYGANHPLAGELIEALFNDGAYALQYGGAPMPFIDMDMIGPVALKSLLKVLTEIAEIQASAT